MKGIEETLSRLETSKFRSSFHLSRKDREYAAAKGRAVLRRHARDFIEGRLGAASPANDGKQTPMSGHPVFKAMHATACCCRGCMSKWHDVPEGRCLTEEEKAWAVDLLMAWIARECTGNGVELSSEGKAPKATGKKFFQEKLF